MTFTAALLATALFVPSMPPPPMSLRGAANSPAYTVRLVSTGDGGHDAEFTVPTQGRSGRIVWSPWLSIASADVVAPVFPVLLCADVFDIPEGMGPSVTWEANGGVLAAGVNFLWDGNGDDVDVINVTATVRDVELHGGVRVARHVRTSGISHSGGGRDGARHSPFHAPDHEALLTIEVH